MAQYKGVEIMGDDAGLIRHMAGVDDIHQTLHDLQGVWDNLSMLGEMSGNALEIGGVRANFASLTGRLLGQLAAEARGKTVLQLRAQARIAINILVRNLFERTADIGFLATDTDLRQFAEAPAAEREALRPALCDRLAEYRRKYSVYADLILIAPDGEVLARLEPGRAPEVTHDAIVAEALASQAPYLERFAPFDLLPDESASLVYACKMTSTDGRRPVGVLVLVFRFDDECRRVFGNLRRPDDWTVIAWLDAEGRVLASSDALQLPRGAVVPLVRQDAGRDGSALLRFAGRQWLARTCDAQPYQGYAGPGWWGVAMVPVEHAFEAAPPGTALPAVVREALDGSSVFPDGVREIPRAAEAIESALRRAVWNGNVSLVAAPAGRDGAFAKTLLREIGRTGTRTREVFSRAIADLRQTVLSAALFGAQARARLAIDLLDRNLYERVNDCRWWALTTQFRRALESAEAPADAGADALGALLQSIHRLYTVYTNLVLFDRQGRVVAVSQPDPAVPVGAVLDESWVRRTLALTDAQAHAVSAFEPSICYGGRPTLVYGAAVRGMADPRRVVGGIGLVFDTEPQLRAMLEDTLARDVRGTLLAGGFNFFADAAGKVVATSTGAPVDVPLPILPAGSPPQVLAWQGQLLSIAVCASPGYREYCGDGMRAFSVVPLAAAGSAVAKPDIPSQPVWTRGAGAGSRLDLASFLVAGQWYALPGAAVLEAIDAAGVLPLPNRAPHVRGSVLHGGRSLLVLDLAQLLGAPGALHGPQAGSAQRQIVLVRGSDDFSAFGLLVDDLGDNPEIDASTLQTLGVGPVGEALVAQVVRSGGGAPDADMLKLLSLPRLVTAAFGTRRVAVPA